MYNLIENLFHKYLLQQRLNKNKFFKKSSLRLKFSCLSLCFILIFGLIGDKNALAQVCGTSGLDGPQNAVPPVNTYFPLAANTSLPAGSKSITLLGVPPNDPNYNLSYGVTPIKSGDLILIIQMQDATADFTNSALYGSGSTTNGPDLLGGTGYTSVGNSGKFEYVVATSDVSLSGGLLEFRGAGAGGGAVNTYTNADFTATRGQRRFQVVRVPQYSNLVLNSNITTPPYNGSVGGIIAFDVAGTMQFNGFSVDASQRGFRGGYGPVANSTTNTNSIYAVPSTSTRSVGKGEGIAGTPRYMWDGFNQVDNVVEGLPNGSYGRGAPGNAGGAGNDHNSGGGGGGNAGFGGIGGRGWQGGNGNLNPLTGGGRPGSSIPLDFSRLVMGGGGGGGDANNATSGVKGGVGGGIILINVEKIDGAGTIRANGGVGEPGAFGSAPDGAGGGGAGGSIFVRSLSASPTAILTLEARGGNGGNTKNDNGNEHGPGGGGGGGFIYTQVPSATINNNVQKGLAGRANDGAGVSHGATDGVDGNSSSFITTNLPQHLQGGGSICYPILTTTLTEQNAGAAGVRLAGTTATYTLTIENGLNNGNAGNVEAWFKLPPSFNIASINFSTTGDASGTFNPALFVGATGVINFGNFNISPGDKVTFTILTNIASNAATGIYHASAQATYLDPTRTNANPFRKITGSTNPFTGFNSTYETGGIVNVIGTNYNGDLLSSSVEDVHINSITIYNACNNAVTGGNFGQPQGEYNVVGPWTPINSGELVKIVDQGPLRGAVLKENLYSLKQTIQSIKPSTAYTLSMVFSRWTGSSGCNPNANATYRVRIYDPSNPSVNLLNVSNTTNNNTPVIFNQTFNTSSNTSSLILLIEEASSANVACPLFVDDITINSPIVITTTSTNVTCNGANNGEINITELSGAAAPYQLSYSFDGGNTYSIAQNTGVISPAGVPFSFQNLNPENYKLKIIDANGCENIRDITISEPPVLTLAETHLNNSCFSNAIGAIDLTVSGGTAPYTYQWTRGGSNYATTQDINGLPQGNYTVTVTDSKGCIKQLSVDILPLTPFTLTGSKVDNICNGASSGAITLIPNGGMGPYSFTWNNGSNVQNQTNLSSGNYTVIGKDALGCEISLSFTISQPTQLTSSITSQTNVSCFGNSTGSVTVTGTNGTGPYAYSLDGATFQASGTYTGLAAATYTVTVRDANGCTVPQTVTITQPAALTLSATANPITCFNGTTTATLTANGGTTPYQYSIDNGATFQTSNIFNNLTAGNYTFKIKDANNCTIPDVNLIITQPAVLTLSTSAAPITCFNGTTTATLTAGGGTAPYQYSIDNGTTFQTSNTFPNLTAGGYTFKIRDANNCTIPDVNLNITQPAVLTLSAAANAITCFNGTTTATLTATGGTAPYQYSIDNGATFQTSNIFPNLIAGSYTFKIRDANNCTIPDVNLNITQPAALTLSASAAPITCFNGTTTATLTASGGITPYQYSIDNGATFQTSNTFPNLSAGSYTFKIRDANNCTIPDVSLIITQPAILTLRVSANPITCFNGTTTATLTAGGGTAPYQYSIDNGATFQTSNTFPNLTAGSYTFKIRDANNCTIPDVNLSITQPASLTLSAAATPITCFNGTTTATLTATGGITPYQYSIDNGATFQTSNIFNNLTAGNYTFKIRDANNCTIPDVNLNITQPAALTLSGTATPISCFNGTTTATLTASGGTTPYQYSIDNGVTFQTSNIFNNLIAGSYTFKIKDANNCTIPDVNLNITQQAILTLTASANAITCFNGTTTATLTAGGGTSPYQYSIDSGATFQTSNTFPNLIAGSYTFKIKDANNCTIPEVSLNITQPAALTLSASATPITCFNGTTTATLTASGGITPYQYSIDNGTTFQTSNIFPNLIAGSYTFKIKDANNCTIPDVNLNITQPAALTLIVTATPITCFNGTTTATLTAGGGTAPYQYSIDNGATFQTSNIFPNLTAGSYTFKIRDTNNCTIPDVNLNITQPAVLTLSASATPITCFNGTTTVTLTAKGGTAPYQYSIDNGATFQTSNIFPNLVAGSYTFKIKDANNCTIPDVSLNITQPAILTLSASANAITCFNGTTTATLTASGGITPYQYSIDNGITFQTSNTFPNLSAGNYTFKIKDANNCTIPDVSLIITQPAVITLSASSTPINCFNGTTTATLTATGGTGPYQYSIDNGATFQTSNIFPNLTAGSYTFKIKDANNCTIPDVSLNITQPSALILSGSATAILCKGGNSTVTLLAIGGTGSYQFSIDGTNFQTANTFNNLLAGNYKFYVKDANNCTIPFITINIIEPSQLTLSAVNTSILCKSGYATITLTATGGTGAYQYSMDGMNFQNSNTFGTIVAGNYNFYVRDANNCSASITNYSITEPPILAITETHVNINCNGDNSGSININISGGAAPYTYTWSNGATTLNQANLPAGAYTILVTDANNCQTSETITLIQPQNLSISASKFNVKCFGEATGNINVTINGGTVPYTYLWNNGAITEDLSGLIAGIYNLKVTDSKGCFAFATIEILQPNNPILISETHINNTCFSQNQGSIDLTLSGGLGPYVYTWSNGSTTQDLNNLAPGNYTVTVTDANNCKATKTIIITPLAPFAISRSQTNVLCNGANTGSINLNLTGGTLPYVITWSNGATSFNLQNLTAGIYSYTATDNNGCEIKNSITISQPALLTITGTNTPILCNGDLSTVTLSAAGGTGILEYSKDGTTYQSSNIFSNLAAGSYTFYVRDVNNCVKTFPLTITQPALLTLTGTNTPILCNRDFSTITLSAAGGTGTYEYSKDGTIYQSSNVFSNLTAGTYTFSVRDVNNCVKTFPITINQPALLTITGTNTPILCNGDLSTVTLSAAGGTGTLEYSKDGTTYESSNIFSNLNAGIYTFSVRDANNCIKTFPVTINQPSLLSITGTNTPILCNGNLSTVTLSAIGGIGVYQFSKDGTTYQSSNIFANLAAGDYTFRVKDANNCVKSFPITINQPAVLNLTESHQNILCFAQATGSINLNITGGTAPYTFVWSNGATSKDLTSLIAGDYKVIVTDANQCKTEKTITILQPVAPLNIVEVHQNIKCFGDASGSINISVSGGTAPYTYNWSNGATSKDLTSLIAGNYTLIVTDANNCTASKNVILNQPFAALTATEIHQDVNCFGVASGSIDISVSGGTAPYTYVWNNSASTQDLANLTAGNYTLNITDDNNCKTSISITIQQPAAPLSMVENHQNVLCFGQATGSISISISGGTAPYTYKWNNNATTKDLNNLAAGIYNLVVTDAKGCTIGKQVQITQPNAPLAITETHENVRCFGEQTGKIDLTVTDGTAPYTYLWANGNTLQNPANLPAGIYSVEVTDANGCKTSKQVQITQPVAPLTLTETHVNNVCFGDKIGAINVTVSGGTAPYTYKWNSGETTQDLLNLAGGLYELKVTDANNCTKTISVTILPLKPFIITETAQNVKCFDESTGAINLNLSGGEAPHTVTWSNGATGAQLSNLKAGNYTYKAVDAYGCTIQKTITIIQPLALKASFEVTNTSCKFSPDGAIALSVTGGTAPFKYTWNGLDRGPNASLTNITSGKYIITITDANSCAIFVQAEVLPGNCAPSADNDKYTTNEDTPITIKTPGIIVNDADPDQDELKVMLSTARDPNANQGVVSGSSSNFNTINGGVIINSEGSFTYTPKRNFAGIEKFVYKVSDGALLSNFATVTIEVLAVNDPPDAVNDNYTTAEDTPFDGTVIPNDSDPDADPLTYRLLGQPNNAVVSFNADGTFRFVPVFNFNGTITFDYQVCDPLGLCDTATVTVIVTPVNDPPLALDDTFKTQINLPFNARVTDNDSDPDNDVLQFSALTQPANGTLIFNTNGTFVYTPRNGFKGTDTFTYRACDPSGLCDNATVTILVQPIVSVNLIPGIGTIKEGEKISITAVLTESIFEDVTVTLGFGGSAINNSDYTLTGNFLTLTIPAGQTTTTQEFTINAINDALRDDGEQVFANITATSSVYVLIGTGSVISITDIYPTSVPLKPEENPDINPDPLVSPNKDGQGNDKFIIYNITKYPDNEVLIFNRWGNEVFKISGYNNNDKAFEGVANVGILTNTNKDLVDGVYYYVIYTTENGVKKINRGYLILKR